MLLQHARGRGSAAARCLTRRFHVASSEGAQKHEVAEEALERFSNFTVFEKPRGISFKTQRIPSLEARRREKTNLRGFEPCPNGYTFVNADLGGGAFARVFLVKNDSTGDLQAMKRVDRHRMSKHYAISDSEAEQMVEQEFWNMQTTKHPHIIKLFEFFQDERYAYFVMEAVNGGTLKQLLERTLSRSSTRRLSEGYVAELLQQALYALLHLHHNSKIHKDVKLENLMLLSEEAPPHLVLIDLGVVESVEHHDEDSDGTVGPQPAGSPQTMAPEVLDCFLGKRCSFDEKCDIFSLGVVAHQLFSGEPLYSVAFHGGGTYGRVDYEATRQNMDCNHLVKMREKGCSEEVMALVEQMVELRPEDRPTALECLNNSWLVRKCQERRIRRLRAEGRNSLGGVALSVEAEEAAGEELLQRERRRICKAILKFSQKTQLRRAVAYHLAASLPVGQLRRAAESFNRVDQDRDGVISYEEISKALSEVLGVDVATGRAAALAMDISGSGFVDFQEFSAAVFSIRGMREEQLLDQLFEKLGVDKDQDMNFDKAMKAICRAMRGSVNQQTIAQWLGPVGRDATGVISMDEFRNLLRVSEDD